jgi:hypothetical protein
MATHQHRHEMGVGGQCIRPKCDARFPHEPGLPCRDQRCPTCGAKLLRAGSYHHEMLLKKRGAASPPADGSNTGGTANG